MSHVAGPLLAMCLLAAAGGLAHAEPQQGHAPWLSVGVLSQPQRYDATRGLWAEAELLDTHGWTLAASAVVDQGTVGIYDQSRTALLDRRDQKAVLSIGHVLHLQGFDVTAAVGAGVVHTSASGDMTDLGTVASVHDDKWTPVAETSARFTIPISQNMAIAAGPTATYYDQYFKFVGGTPAGATHRLAELVIVAGLSYRL